MMFYVVMLMAAFVAFSISAVSGGGAGLALMPVLTLVVPATHVPAALSIGTATSALSRVAAFHHAIRWDIVRWFVPPAIPSTVIGVWLLSVAQASWVQLVVGLFLIANVALLAYKPRRHAGLAAGGWSLVVVGASAGLLSGFIGAVGGVFNSFYLRVGLSKEELVATRAANETLFHLLKVSLYFAFGLLDHDAARVGLIIAVAAVLSSVVARPLLRRVSEAVFRRFNYAAMGIAGIAMVCSAAGALAARHDVSLQGKMTSAVVVARLSIGRDAISFEWAEGSTPKFERFILVDYERALYLT